MNPPGVRLLLSPKPGAPMGTESVPFDVAGSGDLSLTRTKSEALWPEVATVL
jgi:hypothetical protein